MGIIITLLLLFIIFFFGFRYLAKIDRNKKMQVDDNRFKQGGVEVEFSTGQIKIKNSVYKVSQVTGIKSEPNGSLRGWDGIIEVDDFTKPRHVLHFPSRQDAGDFTQRLSVALRKAGGPSFT